MKKSKSPPSKSKSLTAGAVAKLIAEWFPPHLADSWDNVGLQIGDPSAQVRKILTCLEVTAPTLAEARKRGADTMIAHHPLIFRPMKSILESHPAEKLAAELIRARINLVVAHTNMDCAPWGTNQVLAETCGLIPEGPLDPQPLNPDADFKLVIFTPKGHEGEIIEAIHRGGGGRIGLYTHCTFRAEGTGTFRGEEGSKPFIGSAGIFEEAAEYRIESIVPQSARAGVLAEVLKVHPYEEPAYEFYVLAGQAANAGAGAIARPDHPITLNQLLAQVKQGLNLKQVRVSGPAGSSRRISKVAICSGSGGSFLAKAASRGADAYLTGEISYHSGIEAHQRGITVIEVGHFESERIIARPLAVKLNESDLIRESGVKVFYASSDLEPFVGR